MFVRGVGARCFPSRWGDPALKDTAFVRLDVNTAPGVHDLAAGGANLFTCEQCVYGYQDAGTAGQKLFVADTGAMSRMTGSD
ncbi:hypothetical protein ACIHQR_28670 [Corallococcus coralloides]|uniref:hypothetical protein n=1 Tax=Corallococcus coralloides TaxID=184914 RepID=UPI003850B7AA